jgi:hypothetical protein
MPHLAPHGFILRVNREPISALDEETVRRDRAFWKRQTNMLIGNWLGEDTSVTNITQFVEKVYLRKDLAGFTGDPEYVQQSREWRHLQEHTDVCMMYSSWRGAIGEVYLWRGNHGRSSEERERMMKEADLAFRQALALD